MTQRALGLVAALLGAAVVAGLLLLGYDVCRAARSGPPWRRRLLGAGLALLAALGLPACEGAGARPPTVAEDGTDAKTLADAVGWKRVMATWRESEAIASGERGAYPFDRKGKKRALAAIDQAVADADALCKAGLLSEAEAGLLKLDLAELKAGVQAKRPTEMKMATCYEPMMMTPARDSMQRLAARLPLLEALAADETLQPGVARKVLASVEQDRATLSKPQMIERLPDPDRQKARELREQVGRKLAELKTRLARPAQDTPQ
ncbi:MAG: hypothetical protein ACODAJ_05785 [Planctomycetota bacterium]